MITSLTRYRLIVLPLGLFIAMIWLASNLDFVAGSLARNLGFLKANSYFASLEQGNQIDPKLIETSITYLKNGVDLLPSTPSIHRLLGYVYLLNDRGEAAIASWKLVESIDDELRANGMEAEQDGDFATAQDWYKRAIAIMPSNARNWISLGKLNQSQDNWESAASIYNEGILNVKEKGTSDLWYLLGYALNNTSAMNQQEVLKSMDQAIQSDRFLYDYHKVQSHYLRGVTLRALGRDSDAVAEFQWVVKQRPDDYWSYVNLGQLAWQLDKNASTAEQMFLMAIGLRRDDKWGLLGLADVYFNTNQKEKAMELYRAVLVIDPEDKVAATRLQRP